MFGIIKFSISFLISFLLLTIPYNSKPIFYTIHEVSNPITTTIISEISQAFKGIKEKIIDSTKNTLRDIERNKVDKITSSFSASQKNTFKKDKSIQKRRKFFGTEKDHEHHEHYADEEREMLKKILERE